MQAAIDVVGGLAALVSVTSFAPQAWKIVKTRETGDLSRTTWVLTATGFLLWGAYGLLIDAWPLVIESGICLILSGFIAAMAILPRQARHAIADVLDRDSERTRTDAR